MQYPARHCKAHLLLLVDSAELSLLVGMPEYKAQITIRLTPELREAIKEVETNHRIGAAEFIRGLVEAGIAMYQDRGFFSFPVKVIPVRNPRKGP
jgi:predicted DNA-binding protein